MIQPIRPGKRDRSLSSSSSSRERVDSSSKDKKILPGRRHQRHSTEIGSEYHRWWVVRNVLGFETNEHIAGLLLDGFHSVLQQLAIMCGGELFNPDIHGLETLGDYQSSADGTDTSPGAGRASSAPSSSSGTSPSSSSPPGFIENVEEFQLYKSTIGHYCECLWRVCGLQDRLQPVLSNLSPPLRQFLIKLIGYIRAARGKSHCTTQRKKKSRAASERRPCETEFFSPQDTPLHLQPNFMKKREGVEGSDATWNYQQRHRNDSHYWQINSSLLRDGPALVPVSYQGPSQQQLDDRGLGAEMKYQRGEDRDRKEMRVENQCSGGDMLQRGQHFQSRDVQPAHSTPSFSQQRHPFATWDNPSSAQGYARADYEVEKGEEREGKSKIKPGEMKETCHKPKRERAEHFSYSKWIDETYDGRSRLYSDSKSESSWPEFHPLTSDRKAEGCERAVMSPSFSSSQPGTPKVYLDRDCEPAPDTDAPTAAEDQCLKSLLSRPVKIQPVPSPHFVNDDGTKWRGHGQPTETKPAWQTDGGLKHEKRSRDDLEETSNLRLNEHVADPQMTPTDLSFKSVAKTSSDDLISSQHTSGGGKRQVGSTENIQASAANFCSSAPLMYTNPDSRQAHPLGTPVFFYPAGGYPCSDNSLASLPTLVQNIVYNSSGPSLLRPLSDAPSQAASTISSSAGLPQAASSTMSTPLALVSRTAASGPTLMPVYMAGHPALDTLYNLSKTATTASASLSTPSNTAIRSSPGDQVVAAPSASSTRLYQEIGGAPKLPPPPLPSSMNSETSARNSPLQFKITDVRSCGDAHFPALSSRQTKSSNGHKASKSEGNTTADQGRAAYTECQGLSGCRLSILPEASPLKSSSAAMKPLGNNRDIADHELKKPVAAPKPPVPSASPARTSSRSSRRLICQVCELVFPSGTDLLVHRYEQHGLVCGECDSRFLSSSGLQRHKETDHPPMVRCPHCRFVTFSQGALDSHVESEHGTKKGTDLEAPEAADTSKDETRTLDTLVSSSVRKEVMDVHNSP